MSLKQQIDADLKTAMLAGDKTLVTTLRGLKSAILYVEVAKGNREQGLPDPEILDLLTKEAKKRQESADLYAQGGNAERQQAELAEKATIEKYLPKQLDDSALNAIIDEVVGAKGNVSAQNMGQIIGEVKQKTAGQADGGRIAAAVRSRLG
ncbi:MAG TPA: GatB/YqeY domain-containing protein [Patescibacteria group bacterium]|nr:GatB/YqeY domain-containing protein [Patescibacteria group bacterium]